MSIEDFELILSLVARRFSGQDEARLEQRVKSDLGIDGAAADLFHGEVERIFDLDPGQLAAEASRDPTLGEIARFIELTRTAGGRRRAACT
jgi:hypothetical protein